MAEWLCVKGDVMGIATARVVALAGAAMMAGCGSGNGSIGVEAIGFREPVTNAAEDPHDAAAPPAASGPATGTPTGTPTGSSGGGSSPTNLADICEGSFDCEGAAITLSKASGKCTFTVNDQPVIMNADNTLVLPTGESAGTWTGSTTGFTVTGGPNNKATVCAPGTPDGGK
jgi:hypothetical protein